MYNKHATFFTKTPVPPPVVVPPPVRNPLLAASVAPPVVKPRNPLLRDNRASVDSDSRDKALHCNIISAVGISPKLSYQR